MTPVSAPEEGAGAERAPNFRQSLPSVLLRQVIERVRHTTNPPGLYGTQQQAAQNCALVCRDWRDGVLAEARVLRCGAGRPLTAPSMAPRTGLQRVEVQGEAEEGEAADTALGPEYVRSGESRWRQVVEIEMARAPKRLLRLLQAAAVAEAPPPSPLPCFLPALAELSATCVGAAQLADLSRCLTRDRLPALRKLTLTLSGCASPLDWPPEAGAAAGGAAAPSSSSPPLPPPIVELSVLGPPIPLGPYTPPSTADGSYDHVNLEACATVTPRLLRVLAPTLCALAVSVSPSPDATVLVEQYPQPPPGYDEPSSGTGEAAPLQYRQIVPLEALGPLFGDSGSADGLLRLSRLTLCGDLDLWPPNPTAGVHEFEPIFEGGPPSSFEQLLPDERIERLAAAYQRARRARGDDFGAVIGALAPALEALVLLPSLQGDARVRDARSPGQDDDEGDKPAAGRFAGWPLWLGPDRVLESFRPPQWLPECLAGLSRLTELVLADGAADALRERRWYRFLGGPGTQTPIARARTGPVPPALRRLVLGGTGGDGFGPCIAGLPPLEIEGDDALAGLPGTLEELALLPSGGILRLSLPRGLLSGRPALRALDVSPEIARSNAALLSTLDLRGQVSVTVAGEAWGDWYSGMRYEEEGRRQGGPHRRGGSGDDDGGPDDAAGSDWGGGDGDHWAVDYAVDAE